MEFLSADKRKEMQALIESGIDKWLSALTGLSEVPRASQSSCVSF